MKNEKIFQLKIKLIGFSPAIWRKIAVSEDYSFFNLHVAIQDTLDWDDSHLHQFFTQNPFKRNSRYEIISFPTPEMDDVIDERKVRLNQFFKKPKDMLFYEYDFGDSWMHEVKLEKILPKEKKTKYPIFIKGKNACPPEDCGGVGGYWELLEAINNPKHPEHKDMMEWMGLGKGEKLDPEFFDPEKIKFQDPKKLLKFYEKRFSL